ncbi:MAG: T9SS type A sorting domain-containing protein [Bacteroidia bacterium]|nr:T9SS type A sorting domain-containing protein [Bacteroidia bacterium]
MRYWITLIGIGLAWGQSGCPYVRYIHFNACGNGAQEGLNEYLLIWSGSNGFNIDNLRISFPTLPNSNSLDCDNPTPTWICNSCSQGWICPPGLITSLNSTACTGTTFVCISSGQNIPANSWVMLFAGNAPTYVPNTSTLCGAGTVYVGAANQNNGQGRYLNGPSDTQNRRTRIAIDGMPACDMTVNYENVTSASDGDALIIDYNTCIGQTQGANESPSPGCQNPYTPPPGSCYYSGSSSNGVTLYRPNNCNMPSLSVLPVLWAYTHIEGSTLVWHATGLGGDEGARLILEYVSHIGGEWAVIATGLPLIGRYPLERSGFYRLAAPLRGGEVEYSPVVEFRAEPLPTLYPNPAPGGPYLSYPELVYQIEVLDMRGALVYRIAAPVAEDALRGLPSGLYLVRLFTVQGERAQRLLVP